MKGIILAGGTGSRLYPMTKVISKQLMPIYDKPMIYYSLAILMLAKVREILVITTAQDQNAFQDLLKDGSQWGIHIQYMVQMRPEGIAQALILGQDFIKNDSVALILGDNIFYGHSMSAILSQAASIADKGAVVFGYWVKDPEQYGVIKFNNEGDVVDIIEKPVNPPSSYAVTGLYFYDSTASEKSKQLKPSARGELEITDLNKLYLNQKKLFVHKLGRGVAWLDTGTPESLLKASNFIQVIEERQGLKIACLEEIAYKLNYISYAQFENLAVHYSKSSYGNYLCSLLKVNMNQ
jgi:glucose-1-phosphate thymidylyltransferase